MDVVATAAVGAGFGVVASLVTTITTATMTHRFSQRDSIREQDRSAAQGAADVILRLLQLPRHPDEDQHAGETIDQALDRESAGAILVQWDQQYKELLLSLRTIILDFSDPAVRERLEMARLILEFHSDYWTNEGQVEPRTRYIACDDALKCLGAVRRGEPLPEADSAFRSAASSGRDFREWREENFRLSR